MKSRLGKGLSELFNENAFLDALDGETSCQINLDDVVANPYQPRKVFNQEQLQELADSIKEHGVVTPIIVKLVDGEYAIIAGERRCRASRLAGKTTIPAIIRDYTESQMMEIALLENIQREDLSPIEIAISYKSLLTHLGITQEQLSKRVGKSRSQITNTLGLLTLPKEIQDMVAMGELSMGHARVLSKIKDVSRIMEIAKQVKEQGLSVRDIEAIGRDEVKKIQVIRKITNEYAKYQEDLMDALKMNVTVKKGSVIIKFKSDNELVDLIEKVK